MAEDRTTINDPDIALSKAKSILLDPFNLDDHDLSLMLSTLLSSGGEMGDIYFQAISHESWILEDREVKILFIRTGKGLGLDQFWVKSQDLLIVKFLKKNHFYRQLKLPALLQQTENK